MIRKGEGISVEFKECRNKLNKDVFESICAFLNRNGGDLLLGVNDKGKITGIAPEAVEQVKKDMATALNNPQKLDPPCYLMPEEVVLEGKRVSLRDHINRQAQNKNTMQPKRKNKMNDTARGDLRDISL